MDDDDQNFFIAVKLEALLWILLLLTHWLLFLFLHMMLGAGFTLSVLLTLGTLLTILWIVGKVV